MADKAFNVGHKPSGSGPRQQYARHGQRRRISMPKEPPRSGTGKMRDDRRADSRDKRSGAPGYDAPLSKHAKRGGEESRRALSTIGQAPPFTASATAIGNRAPREAIHSQQPWLPRTLRTTAPTSSDEHKSLEQLMREKVHSSSALFGPSEDEESSEGGIYLAQAPQSPPPNTTVWVEDPSAPTRSHEHVLRGVTLDIGYASPPPSKIILGKLHQGVLSSAQKRVVYNSGGARNIIGEGGEGTVFRGVATEAAQAALGCEKEVAVKRHQEPTKRSLAFGAQKKYDRLAKGPDAAYTLCIPGATTVDTLSRQVEVAPLMLGSMGQIWPALVDGIAGKGDHDQAVAANIFSIIMANVAEGLTIMHESGFVHRDVKPDNIFLGKDLEVKLGDFGIMTSEASLSSGMAQKIGSQWYMAPELRSEAGSGDCKSDIFSVGVIIRDFLTAFGKETITGFPTDAGRGLVSLDDAIPKLSAKSDEVLGALTTIGRYCLIEDPAHRPDSKTLLKALEKCSLREVRKDAKRSFQSLITRLQTGSL